MEMTMSTIDSNNQTNMSQQNVSNNNIAAFQESQSKSEAAALFHSVPESQVKNELPNSVILDTSSNSGSGIVAASLPTITNDKYISTAGVSKCSVSDTVNSHVSNNAVKLSMTTAVSIKTKPSASPNSNKNVNHTAPMPTTKFSTKNSKISSSPIIPSLTKQKKQHPIDKTTVSQGVVTTKQKSVNATTKTTPNTSKQQSSSSSKAEGTIKKSGKSSQNQKQNTKQAHSSGVASNSKSTITSTNTLNKSGTIAGTSLIADMNIVKMVNDILTLLQTYGPLTYDQLEYNLPPFPTTNNSNNVKYDIQDILDILVVTGIVRLVKDGKKHANENERENAPKGNDNINPQQQQQHQKKENDNPKMTGVLKYAFLDGNALPRADSITPLHSIFYLLESARCEIVDSQKRINMLREELKQTASTKNNTASTSSGRKRKYFPKDILQKILSLFPNLISDPVYSMAFRNCHVDRTIVMNSGPTVILPSKVLSSSSTSLGTPKKKIARKNSKVSTSASTPTTPTVASVTAATSVLSPLLSFPVSQTNSAPANTAAAVGAASTLKPVVKLATNTANVTNLIVPAAQASNIASVANGPKKEVVLAISSTTLNNTST